MYRLIRWLAWLFFPKFKVYGAENLPDTPCVIVGNHSHMYGPVAGVIYTPGPHYVWCAGEMMNLKEVPAYAYQDFWSQKPKVLRPFFRIASYVIAPIAAYTFTNAETVAVYHDMRIVSTFRDSMAKLEEGNSIVIFPEHNVKRNNVIYDFQDKFIDLARFYHKKSGEAVSFVPLYIAPKLKAMYFGKPIAFQADAPIDTERSRICGYLMDAITETAVSLPEHTVIPYPNISKRYYPKNIPLEVADEKKEAC